MWRGPRPTCTPSFILIRPTVWPQCTNVTGSTDRQTDRQRTDSIGRTVLQTVAPKRFALCYRSVALCVCNVRALWPNGSTDQDETSLAGRPRLSPHCVRWGSSSPSPKEAQPPIFGPYQLRPNGCMDQDVTWYGARLRPRRLC